ncbi:hypothetical protein [Streptomyces cavernicola]|uniref:DUF7847 domain-containing protein n=1 Tax=Streptomyces cavernicola TaxID=3043613 RepID=A0ABT6S9P7_9ACTN|nr:hypothetical protein [Streptomyces sp. B-S-A6]MDI3404860.1 hypothetical protein [Streptomyces sp. B-S-A6]
MSMDKGRGGPERPEGPNGGEHPEHPEPTAEQQHDQQGPQEPHDQPPAQDRPGPQPQPDPQQHHQPQPQPPQAPQAPPAPQTPQAAPPPGPYPGAPGPYGPGPGGPYPGAPGPDAWGRPGWGAWGPPPAPKPGVIPLRPLQLGDILGGTFAAVGRCWKSLFGISLIAYGGAILALALAVGLAYGLVGDHFRAFADTPDHDEPLWTHTQPVIVAGISLWVFAVLVMIVASATVSAVCPAALQDAVLGKPSTFGAVWRRTMARVPAVIGTGLLTALIVAVPILLLAGVGLVITVVSVTDRTDPGPVLALWVLGMFAMMPLVTWLWIRFSLAPAAAVFESAGPVTALRRSARLVRGSWWRIFGISLLVHLMAGIAGYLIQLPFNMIGMFSAMPAAGTMSPNPDPAEVFAVMGVFMFFIMLGALISQLVTSLFPQLATSLLYVDQRIRKESLDVTLAQAAGVPLTPAPAPTPYQG